LSFFDQQTSTRGYRLWRTPREKARILARLRSAAFGNFGDCEAVGEGVSEMRVYVLLTGGYKATQSKDIARAKTMARAIRENQR
jgi:putative component of toxin-antitoxin plasmid stabilization module